MDDLIKREDAIEVVKKWFEVIELNPDILIDSIISIPSADRPQGEWECDEYAIYHCSNCGCTATWDYNYCPNCGSRNSKRIREQRRVSDETAND